MKRLQVHNSSATEILIADSSTAGLACKAVHCPRANILAGSLSRPEKPDLATRGRLQQHRKCALRMPSSASVKLKEALTADWKVILGSASKSRRGIFDRLSQEQGFTYDVLTADIDERSIGDRTRDPEALVLELARAKACAISHKLGQGQSKTLLITCDQVVVHEDRILEKPVTEEEAWAFIRGYARGPAKTVGSVICTNLWSSKAIEALDIAEVHFNSIPDSATADMIKEGIVFYAAGGLVVEHPKVAPFIKKIVGTVDGVMGIDKDVALRVMSEALE